jgi:multiple antibiotic resistance protein
VAEIFSAAVVFFLIMDPLGNVPLFLSVLRTVDQKKHLKITIRELLIAYVALLLYLFGGAYILKFLQLSQEAISISGGIILFIIAIRMIFPSPHGIMGGGPDGEPFIVPLAIPAVAGPSIMAVLMLMSTTTETSVLLTAITAAWIATAVILLAATPMNRILGQRGLMAIERLMGMILVMMSVQMMLNALEKLT